jgi:hypothetical protein
MTVWLHDAYGALNPPHNLERANESRALKSFLLSFKHYIGLKTAPSNKKVGIRVESGFVLVSAREKRVKNSPAIATASKTSGDSLDEGEAPLFYHDHLYSQSVHVSLSSPSGPSVPAHVYRDVISDVAHQNLREQDVSTTVADFLENNVLAFNPGDTRIVHMREGKSYVRADYSAKREIQCLAEAIYFEARGETFLGQFAVGEVILNRVDSKYWPNDVCAIVSQGDHMLHRCQFSYRCDGNPESISDEGAYKIALKISEAMLMGASRRLTGDATHYHAHYVQPYWIENMEKTAVVGSHVFYKNRFSFFKSKPPKPVLVNANFTYDTRQ